MIKNNIVIGAITGSSTVDSILIFKTVGTFYIGYHDQIHPNSVRIVTSKKERSEFPSSLFYFASIFLTAYYKCFVIIYSITSYTGTKCCCSSWWSNFPSAECRYSRLSSSSKSSSASQKNFPLKWVLGVAHFGVNWVLWLALTVSSITLASHRKFFRNFFMSMDMNLEDLSGVSVSSCFTKINWLLLTMILYWSSFVSCFLVSKHNNNNTFYDSSWNECNEMTKVYAVLDYYCNK